MSNKIVHEEDRAKSQKTKYALTSSSDEDVSDNIPEKEHKEQPTATRGRGRPPKNGVSAVYREKRPDPEPRGRGRPPKRGKTKTVVATGRGRGRPKKRPKSESSGDESANNEANDKLGNSSPTIKSPKQRGRPKKPRNEDQESGNDDDDRVPERTGPGPGRPRKKPVSDSPGGTSKRDKENVNVAKPEVAGKRGRPPKVKPSATTLTGKPRGRPKAVAKQEQSKDDDEEELEMSEEENTKDLKTMDDEEEEFTKSDDDDDDVEEVPVDEG